MPRLEPHDAFRRLARRKPRLGVLDAVVDRVAQQVTERCVELLQNVAVDLGRVADDLEVDLLSERPAHVANHPRQCAHTVCERPHPACEC